MHIGTDAQERLSRSDTQEIIMYLYCIILIAVTRCASAHTLYDTCKEIDSGWVCGTIGEAEAGAQYASFRGIPYGEQPVGKLRFKELQPVKPWSYYLNATEDGPICPQYDELYSRLMDPQKPMSEACIHVNVHVPIMDCESLPVLVFVHGGGYQSGSGNSDLYGPEYLVSKGILVITFNYRINVLGFLGMNNKLFPGNTGLRDIYWLLRWVQRNVAAFGGNPNDVTLAGQGAGAASTHIMALSKAARGLFKRAILLSGTALPSFYDNTPTYVRLLADMFLAQVGITSKDPEQIHEELINMPIDKIMTANRILQRETGLITFAPVTEGSYPGVTRILDDEPESLIKEGRDKHIPMIIGFSTKECFLFKQRAEYLNFVGNILKNPSLILSPKNTYSLPPKLSLELGERVMNRYFNETPCVDDYLRSCTDLRFIYPAFKLAQWRAEMKGEPVYLYQFSFDATFNVVKNALMLNHEGGGSYAEILAFIFRTNSMQGNLKTFPAQNRDHLMTTWMTDFVSNFMKCDKPFCSSPSSWPPVDAGSLNYQSLYDPLAITTNMPATDDQREMIKFFDYNAKVAMNG